MTGRGKNMTEWWCDQIIQGEWYDELIAAHVARRDRAYAEEVPIGPVRRIARPCLDGSRLRFHALRRWLQQSWVKAGVSHTEAGR